MFALSGCPYHGQTRNNKSVITAFGKIKMANTNNPLQHANEELVLLHAFRIKKSELSTLQQSSTLSGEYTLVLGAVLNIHL